jgi:spore coat protein H
VLGYALTWTLVTTACGGGDAQTRCDDCECSASGSCEPDPDGAPEMPGTPETTSQPVTCAAPDDPLPPLRDRQQIYEGEEPGLWTMQLRVDDRAGLAAVESDLREPDGRDVRVQAVFTHDGHYGAAATAPNATLQLRGRSTRSVQQKSYKISILKGHPDWRGQREINLNKHPFDLTRVRNKLAFDLFRRVNHFSSLRTHFVRLTINGEDRGLFTYVEEPDRHFLASHGLDPAGALYKAEQFSFQVLDGQALADPARREQVVRRRGADDIARLERLISAVTDSTQDINAVVARHLNRDNYLTWLAVNVLSGNVDTKDSNFYLYSPTGCEGWYFLPWDYDGALGYWDQPGGATLPRWRRGLSNWWNAVLHQRFLRDPDNLAALLGRVEELRAEVFNEPVMAALLDSYHPVVAEGVLRAPDLWSLPYDAPAGQNLSLEQVTAQWQAEYQRLRGISAQLVAEFLEALQRPMPVILFAPQRQGQELRFSWEPAHDLQGDALAYELLVSSAPEFAAGQIVVQRGGLTAPEVVVPAPPAGTYYWRVVIRDAQGNWQTSFHEAEMLVVQ